MNRLAQGLATLGVVLATILVLVYSREISQFIVGLFTKIEMSPQQANNKNIRAGTWNSNLRTQDKDLHHLEEVSSEHGEVLHITTLSGWEVELLENSRAILELYRPENPAESPALLSILSGQYKLLKPGAPGRFFIMQNKKIFSPQIEMATETRTIELSAPTTAASAENEQLTDDVRVQSNALKLSQKGSVPMPDKVPTNEGDETLSNTYIEQVLMGQANALRNCQLNSIRENKNSNGRLIFSFTIMPAGKIEKLVLVQDQLKNPELANCAKSVLERTQFKNFTGKPIQLSYPVEFR